MKYGKGSYHHHWGLLDRITGGQRIIQIAGKDGCTPQQWIIRWIGRERWMEFVKVYYSLKCEMICSDTWRNLSYHCHSVTAGHLWEDVGIFPSHEDTRVKMKLSPNGEPFKFASLARDILYITLDSTCAPPENRKKLSMHVLRGLQPFLFGMFQMF